MTLAPSNGSSTSIVTKQPDFSGFGVAAKKAKGAFAQATMDNMVAAFEVAVAVAELREYLDNDIIKGCILGLMNTQIGFKTDKDPKIKRWSSKENRYVQPEPYPYAVVKDAVIEALLRGVQICGNHFNIISERCYITQEGYAFLIRGISSVVNFKPVVGVPIEKPKGAIVECSASWMQNGKEMQISASIPVKGDERTATADQYIGKATRKLLKRCFDVMNGNISLDDEELTPAAQEGFSFGQLPEGEAKAVSEAIAAVSASAPVLSKAQHAQLQASMLSVLAQVGQQAFEIDACRGYGVSALSEIPASSFGELMRNLGNPTFQAQWNQGLSVSGETLVTPFEVAEPEKELELAPQQVKQAPGRRNVQSSLEDQL